MFLLIGSVIFMDCYFVDEMWKLMNNDSCRVAFDFISLISLEFEMLGLV